MTLMIEYCQYSFFNKCLFMYRPQEEQCRFETETFLVSSVCELQRETYKNLAYKSLYISEVYEIYSPQYFGIEDYPNNTYCVWNISDTGIVHYHLIDQQLQEPSNCDKACCDCTDSVKITMGFNQIRLCGSDKLAEDIQISDNGLQVTFCSDNTKTAKGFHLMAYKTIVSASPLDCNKRETTISEVGYNNHILCSN